MLCFRCSDHRTPLEQAAPALLDACEAAVCYDKAIRSCANDPDKMASYCTAAGEELDDLYADWVAAAHAAIAKAKPDASEEDEQ